MAKLRQGTATVYTVAACLDPETIFNAFLPRFILICLHADYVS